MTLPPATTRFTFPPFDWGGEGGAPSLEEAARYCIHIIDDDAPLGAALSAGLEAHGYRTFFSPAAEVGLEEARANPPDLILCDINMPRCNGHDLLEKVRADPVLADCQFVFMTGNPLFAQPRKGMELGADDFLLKPFSLETLVACVAARLRRKAVSEHGEAVLIEQLRASLNRTMSHELFTPLTGIIGLAELLEQDIETMKPAEVRGSLANIRLSGQRLHRTLRNYLFTLDRLRPDSEVPFPVIPADSLQQLIEQGARRAARRHEREADLTIAVAGGPLLFSPQEFVILVEELVDNACSFSPPGSAIAVQAGVADGHLVLGVVDAGRGMTAGQLRALGAFRQFERNRFEQQGLGVGLFIVRQILRRARGTLSIESTPGHGTRCFARIPLHALQAAAG